MSFFQKYHAIINLPNLYPAENVSAFSVRVYRISRVNTRRTCIQAYNPDCVLLALFYYSEKNEF